ncbi:MAG: hypothetical protein HPY50_04980 [Firmicutes bacterium]|nr:hypothetical protein [Bacillota bacterium]
MEHPVEKAAEKLVQAVKGLEKKIGAYSFNYFQGTLRILVGLETFKQIAQGLATRQIKSTLPDYPWKTEVDIKGVTFVALLNQEPE